MGIKWSVCWLPGLTACCNIMYKSYAWLILLLWQLLSNFTIKINYFPFLSVLIMEAKRKNNYLVLRPYLISFSAAENLPLTRSLWFYIYIYIYAPKILIFINTKKLNLIKMKKIKTGLSTTYSFFMAYVATNSKLVKRIYYKLNIDTLY